MDQLRNDLALLYRRAGFGARPAELDALAAGGYEAAVDALVAGTGDMPDPAGDAVPLPSLTAPQPRSQAAPESAARKAQQAQLHSELLALQTWWLDRMITTATPLREKLALLWHGHFATGIPKVRYPLLMYRQNQLFRTAGAGSFEALTQAVAKDAAMMRWLDTDTDKVAHPNENFSRELMELFTLGVGNYSQEDVAQAARGFTGWASAPVTWQFHLQTRQHDNGMKTFLGHTGDFGGEQIIDIVVHQPASQRFVIAKLWSHLAYPVAPSDPIVDGLLPAYGPDVPLTTLLRAIFLHPEFRSPASRTGLVKQPIEWLVGAARALGLDAEGGNLVPLAATLGQIPFNPPNVGGWPQNAYWLDSATALARLRAARVLATRADLSGVAAQPASQGTAAVAALLSIDGWGRTTASALNHVAARPPDLVTLALTAPEYVLN